MRPSETGSFSWQPQSAQKRMRLSLLLLLAAALAAGLLFVLVPGSPLSLAPLLIFAAWRFLPLLGEKADQHILIGFLIFCLTIDDITQNPWGRQLEPLTKVLGVLLFKSFGITGMEAFAIFFSLWLLLTRQRSQVTLWIHQGLLRILAVAFTIFFCSTLAGMYGILSGGDPIVHFIQTRFLHAFPFWTFIGFVVLRDSDFAKRLIFWITIMAVLKAFQALYMYIRYRGIFSQAEYLIDHYYSLYAVIALLALLFYMVQHPHPLSILVNSLAFFVTLVAYILNDRRTSFVGFGLALILVPFLLPANWIRKHILKLITIAVLGVLYVAATWNLPPPIGFVGNLIQSFGEEGGAQGPSYRDLENGNLFHAIVQNPFTGLGYGKEFEEKYKMPDISFVYDRYRMIPHNLFLAAWAYGGPLTVSALSLVFASMIWLAGRLMRESAEPALFFIGIIALFYFMQYLAYVFGDLGLQINRNQMLGGLFLGGCYRLLKEYDFDRTD